MSREEQRSAYNAAYYAANREKRRAEMAKNYQQNSEVYKARARRWERENAARKRAMRAQYRAANRDKIKQIGRADWRKHNVKRRAAKRTYRAAHPELGAHDVRLRQTRKQQATPAWADLAAMKAMYRRAAELSRRTGVKHHVDHDVPLKHPLVCGLHNEFNLRVIPAVENQSKGNSFSV